MNDYIDEAHNIAKERAGFCLSSKCSFMKDKLKWKCILNHEWEATFYAIKNNNSWCPICCYGMGEKVCRLIFETIFNAKFSKARPNFLKNELTNRNLELDGFNEDLKIAFEYNGLQHYQNVTKYSRSKYDDFKINKCKENNIKLFIIKEIRHPSKYEEMINQIKEQNIDDALNFNIKINLLDIYSNPREIEHLNKIREICKNKNGECLSTKYLGDGYKLEFKCFSCNYIWFTQPSSIKQGRWCPQCVGKQVNLHINVYKNHATSKGGYCLSNEIPPNNKLIWKCNLGHIWEANRHDVRNHDTWCPECSLLSRTRIKYDIQIYKDIAIKFGGECLSNDFEQNRNYLIFKCKEGHVWEGSKYGIKRGRWCKICNKPLRDPNNGRYLKK